METTKNTTASNDLKSKFELITGLPVKYYEVINNYGFITDANNAKWSVKLTSKGVIKVNSLRSES